jgi:hypothetical protein
MAKERPEIEQWLQERGHTNDEIAKILERLEQFDANANRESLFDAMETGELDMDALIKDALGEK